MQERSGEFIILKVQLPDRPLRNAGILLRDESSDRLHLRFRDDWDSIAGPEDAMVLAGLPGLIGTLVAEMGVQGLLMFLEDSFSNTVRISGRNAITFSDPIQTVDELFRQHCQG
jgi:hypothetical protein